MQEVNIYVQATAKGPAIRKKAAYVYIIQLTSDKEYIRKGEGVMENVTENQIVLTAIIKALMRFSQKCTIRINTECEHVLNSCRNGWPHQWEKNGWKKATGKEVKNADLWQQYINVSKGHAISWSDEKHEFSTWMADELKRMEKQWT